MIGVIAQEQDHEILRELFELFKVPWEFHRPGGVYHVVLAAIDDLPPVSAPLTLHFSSRPDSGEPTVRGRRAEWRDTTFPLYGETTTFDTGGEDAPVDQQSRQPLACNTATAGQTVVRFGYNVCGEVRHLLTAGQPVAHAATPTLDLHISIVRETIVGHGLPLAEIRPCPAGHPFMVCLTHDVDHPSLRLHRMDATTAGFLVRAVVTTFLSACRRRVTWKTVARNWIAACKLPFVHLRLVRDFWLDFAGRFLAIEAGLGSTFFFIPRKGHPGRAPEGSAPAARASGYEPADIAPTIASLRDAGCEIGLHGVDAWHDREAAVQEKTIMEPHASPGSAGIRMHWLYFNAESPKVLDAAGFAYDSTFGYNETIGFRAGTTQAFRPPGTQQLLELPLHVMDTALFYPDYLGLTATVAMERCREVTAVHAQHGGALTINWHDRSVAPERCWDTFYEDFIDHLKCLGAWFPTAERAVAWFRRRRAASVQLTVQPGGSYQLTATTPPGDEQPPLCLRLHNLALSEDTSIHAQSRTPNCIDVPLGASLKLVVRALAAAVVAS